MSIAVKICGLNSQDALQAAINAGADYAGFVYYPASPRHISLESAAKLKHQLPASIRSVAVIVNPDIAFLHQVDGIFHPDYIQLHGVETPEFLREIRADFPQLKLIKAIAVKTAEDITQAERFYDVADMIMFDAKPPAPSATQRADQKNPTLPGGNGISFDWGLLKGFSAPLPWFLSGGLTVGNVSRAIAESGPTMVDVSSGVERAPGVKDLALIEAFVKAARNET